MQKLNKSCKPLIMAQYNSMKLLGNKNAQFNIEIMEWSDKMDLLAIANEKGISQKSIQTFYKY